MSGNSIRLFLLQTLIFIEFPKLQGLTLYGGNHNEVPEMSV